MSRRAAVYLRNSTEEQINSPERQLNQVRAYCQSKSYTIVRQYQDQAMKGYDDSRPDFQRLLKDATTGLFDVVVVDEQSRLTRNDPLEFFAKVAHPLKAAGVVLDTVAKGMQNWDDLAGLILQTVDQHQSNSEVVTLSRRVTTELARKALEGSVYLNKARYGYEKVWLNEQGEVVHRGDRRAWAGRPPAGCRPTLVIHPEEAEVVRWIFDAYSKKDLSISGIAKELYERGILTPLGKRFWNRALLHDFLTCRMYLGDYVFNRRGRGRFHQLEFTNGDGRAVPQRVVAGKARREHKPESSWVVITDNHPAIISREQFAQVQALLKNNLERRSPGTSRKDYPLAKLLVCENCGSWMTGQRYSQKNRPTYGKKFYMCSTYLMRGPKGCHPYMVWEEDILDMTVSVVSNHFLNADKLAELRHFASDLQAKRDAGGHVEKLKKDVRALDQKIKKATTNFLLLDAPQIADAQKQLRAWEAERKGKQQELEAATKENPVEEVEKVIAHIKTHLVRLREGISTGDMPTIRTALRSSVVRVQLRFETVKKTVRNSHRLTGGVFHLHDGQEVAMRGMEKRLENEGEDDDLERGVMSGTRSCYRQPITHFARIHFTLPLGRGLASNRTP